MTRLNYVEERDDRKGQEYSTLPCSEPENFWEQNRPVVATIHIVGGGGGGGQGGTPVRSGVGL